MSLKRDPSYPLSVVVRDQPLTLRYMSSKDAESIQRFAEKLSEHDLLFLRRDIRQLEVVEDWLMDIDSGDVLSILAKRDGEVVGEATVHRDHIHWSQHVGELRVVVAPSMRGLGLGKLLAKEALELARRSGILKMMARMTVDQKGAIALFRGMGFEQEALLRDHVMDLEEKTHDLVVMSVCV